jgi:hypothetical protein
MANEQHVVSSKLMANEQHVVSSNAMLVDLQMCVGGDD